MKKNSFFLLLFLCGCLSGPNFQKPEIAISQKFIEAKKTQKIQDIKDWWVNFYDADLQHLIDHAIQKNFDVEIAKEKIREARAMYNLEKAKLFPEIDINGNYERRQVSQAIYETRFIGPPDQDLYQFGFDASWEIDIFGKIRRGKKAAYHEIKAMIEDMNDIIISLICEIAKFYVESRFLQQFIHLQEKLIEKQNDKVRLLQDKFYAGLIDEIIVENEKQQLNNYRAEIEPYKGLLQRNIYYLTYLVNMPMGSLDTIFAKTSPLPDKEDMVPAIVPSELLLRRADIRKSLQELAKDTNKVGEAIADYFPRFSLTGHYGWRSSFKDQMFSSNSNIWWIGPSVYWPLLDFGRIRSNVKATKTKQQQSLLNYEKTVLYAFQEVEIAFSYYFKNLKQLQHVRQAFLTTQKQKNLENDLFASGLKDQMSLLEKEMNNILAEQKYLDTQSQKMVDLISLYKTLGGGWICSASP